MPRGRPRKDQEQGRETAPAAGQETPREDQTLRDQEGAFDQDQGQEPLDRTVAEYFEYFQLDIQPQELVDDFIAKLIQQDQEQAGTHAPNLPQEQTQVPAPDEQQNPVPLNVRITSLEMDGSTRAFAAADYGDLTVNRLRVKQDEYGTLSVSMPRYRQSNGWKDTCAFNTVESRNRLTGAVLDAYDRQLAQIQGQGQTESDAQGQTQGDVMDEGPDMDGQEQEGPSMSMGMSQ